MNGTGNILGVGIIGAGSFGEQHAQALAALDDVRLVAATRTNPAALAVFQQHQLLGCVDHRMAVGAQPPAPTR